MGSEVASGCLWMLSLADFLCFLPVRPMPRLRGISVHATAARRTRRGRLLDGDLQQDGAHVKSVVAGASGLARGRGVYREACLPNTFGMHTCPESGPEKFYSQTEPFPPLLQEELVQHALPKPKPLSFTYITKLSLTTLARTTGAPVRRKKDRSTRVWPQGERGPIPSKCSKTRVFVLLRVFERFLKTNKNLRRERPCRRDPREAGRRSPNKKKMQCNVFDWGTCRGNRRL